MLNLYCDIDSTLNDHINRIKRNSENGIIKPTAFTRSEIMKDEPLPGAVDALWRFKKFFDIHYLSSRYFPDAKSITEDWLMKHNFPIDSINLVKMHFDKIGFLNQRKNSVDLYIDDFTIHQERTNLTVQTDIMNGLNVPYERFMGNWQNLVDKYFHKLPNGETVFENMLRNLAWWKRSYQIEKTTRWEYYKNFFDAFAFDPSTLKGKVVGEVGAGPFGGMIEVFKIPAKQKVFVDIYAHKLKSLQFIQWDVDALIIESPVEKIDLPDKSVDFMLSYNAIDHGWDVFKGLDEVLRVSRHGLIAFDCKGDKAPKADRLDHYQEIFFAQVRDYLSNKGISVFDLKTLSKFHHKYNWGFPIASFRF